MNLIDGLFRRYFSGSTKRLSLLVGNDKNDTSGGIMRDVKRKTWFGRSLVKKAALQRALAALLLIAASGLNLALAQEFDFDKLPVLDVKPDFNGVDPTSGSYSTVSPLSFSAPGAGRLNVQSWFNGRSRASKLSVQLSDNTYTPGTGLPSERHININLGGISKLFTCGDVGDCTQDVNLDGSKLTRVSTDHYVFTDKYGAVYTFFPLWYQTLDYCYDPTLATGCNAAEYRAYAHVSTIQYPNGEKLTYQPYTSVVTVSGQKYARDTIQSNLGYKMVFENPQPSDYTANNIAGRNWLSHKGAISAKVSLYRGAQLINALTTTESWSNNNTLLTVTHKDDLNRTYQVKYERRPVRRCSVTDHTPSLPIWEKSPGGVITNISYHLESNAYFTNGYKESAGPGTSIPVKTIKRGSHTWHYDNVTNNKTITDPDSQTRTITYNWRKDGYDYGLLEGGCPIGYLSTQITSYTDELNRQSNYSYLKDLLDEGTLPEGNGYDYDYDDRGNLAKITQLSKSTSSLSDRIVFEAGYPASCNNLKTCNKPLWTKDAKGLRTDYTYSSTHGGVLTVTEPAQPNGVRPKTNYSYSARSTGDGTIWRQTQKSLCVAGTTCAGTEDHLRVITAYWNNTFLPESRTEFADDNSVDAIYAFTYDSAGRMTTSTDPKGQTTSYFYDAVGQKIGEISPDPDGSSALPRLATRITYNPDGQPTKVESGTATGTTLSALNAMSVTQRVETSYDSVGRKKQEKTVAGSTTYAVKQYSYDAWNRPLCTAVRMNLSSWPSNACDAGTDGPHGYDRVTRNQYDAAGQLKKVYRAYDTPLQHVYAEYEYSGNGKRTAVIDANNNKARLTYDGYDRQVRWYFPSKTKGSGTHSSSDYEQYGYDLNDNRTSYRRRDGVTLTYQYDNLNRMTRKTVPARSGLSSSHTRDVFYGYDSRGLQLYARFGSHTGQGVYYEYNALGHMELSDINLDGVLRRLIHGYDSNGNRTRMRHPDGHWFTYSYDNLDRLNSITHASAGTLATYSYKPEGQLRMLGGGLASSYGHDGIGRLTSLTHNLSGTSNDNTYGYQYNPASQITQQTISNNNYAPLLESQGESYAVNGLNQYTKVAGTPHTYDVNGNLTSDGQTNYTYDQENRLVKATTTGGALKAELWYDPLGRLYKVQTPSGITHFLYDGDELVAEYNGTSTTVKDRYIHGASVDDPVAWFQGSSVTVSTRRYLRANHQGSIVAVTNASASMLSLPRYDTWGQPQQNHPLRFGYTGQAWIEELGLWHYKARFYSPRLGRFLQVDPVGYKDQMNLYAYVRNDPLNNADPTGMEMEEIVVTGTRGCGCSMFRDAWMDIVMRGPGEIRDSIQSSIRNRVFFATVGGALVSDMFSDSGEVEEEYDSLEDAVGEVNPLDDVEYEGKTKDVGLRGQGYTEKWSGVNSNGEIQSAFKNPKTGKWTGGHRSSKNDKFW